MCASSLSHVLGGPQAKAEGLAEEKEGVTSQLKELQKTREELTTDNRRLAEIVMTMEGESEEAAAMLEMLTRERRALRTQCAQLRESGEQRNIGNKAVQRV